MSKFIVVEFNVWLKRNWDDVRRDCQRCGGLGLELCPDCGGYGVVLGLHGNNASIQNVPCGNTLMEDADVHVQVCEACMYRAKYIYERNMNLVGKYVSSDLCITPAA